MDENVPAPSSVEQPVETSVVIPVLPPPPHQSDRRTMFARQQQEETPQATPNSDIEIELQIIPPSSETTTNETNNGANSGTSSPTEILHFSNLTHAGAASVGALSELSVPTAESRVSSISLSPSIMNLLTPGSNPGAISAKHSLRHRVFMPIVERIPSQWLRTRLSPYFQDEPAGIPGLDAVFHYDEDAQQKQLIPFIMDLGRSLAYYGIPAHRLEFHVVSIADRFGLRPCHVYSTPTGIFFSFGPTENHNFNKTRFLRIEGSDIDLDRLSKIEMVTYNLAAGRITCQEAKNKIREIEKQNSHYCKLVVLAAYIVCSSAFSILLHGGWKEAIVAAVIGGFVALLTFLASLWSAMGRVFLTLSSFGGMVFACLMNLLGVISYGSTFMVTLSGVIVLVPGLTFTLGVVEIATRNLVSGSARLVSAAATILELGFGMAVSNKLCNVILPLKHDIPVSDPFPDWVSWLMILLLSFAFAVVLQAYMSQMWVILIASFAGWSCGVYGTQFFGVELGSFLGSLVICIIGNLYAWISRHGLAIVPIFCGTLLLVPGSMGLRVIDALMHDKIESGVMFGFSMIMTAVSLVMGMLVANFVVPPHRSKL